MARTRWPCTACSRYLSNDLLEVAAELQADTVEVELEEEEEEEEEDDFDYEAPPGPAKPSDGPSLLGWTLKC